MSPYAPWRPFVQPDAESNQWPANPSEPERGALPGSYSAIIVTLSIQY